MKFIVEFFKTIVTLSTFSLVCISCIYGQVEKNKEVEIVTVKKTVISKAESSNSEKTVTIITPSKTRFTPLIKEHKTRLIFNISNEWINSGITLDSNKVYYVIANGLASTSSYKSELWIGPEGKEHKLNGMRMYSVLGKMGLNEAFYIGNNKELKPKKNTPLFIGYNDDMFGDNVGYYVIDIFEGTEQEIKNRLEEEEISIGKYYYE